jgi:hypothetical protein
VREPALVTSPDHGNTQADTPRSEAMEPVISSSTESDRGDRPPRSGWWSRRVFGRN